MTIHVVETGDTMDVSLEGVHPIPLLEADKVRALLLNLEAGQAVAPCRMSVAVLYYVIEGRGRLNVGDEQAFLQAGSLVSVPAGAVRTISAAERTRILAVQVA